MSIRFSVLASGSTGNVFYVATEKQKLLVDVGVSGKALDSLLAQIGENDPKSINGILVTHEHSDHIKGVGIAARKYKIPIYANQKTWNAMEGLIGTVPTDQKFIFESHTEKTFGDIDVESFGVSHDAAEPQFYVFHHEGKKISIMTDTGYASDRMKRMVANSDALVFESNHDVEMLRMGHYPWNIKRRILGDYGHLSNEDAAYALTEIIGEKTKRIYLAHLSKDNNMKDLARMVNEQTLQKHDIDVGREVMLYDTDPSTPTAVVKL